MVLGIIHYTFLAGGILLLIAAFSLFMYYRTHRLRLTQVFLLFILSFAGMNFTHFTRGLFATLTPESILLFRIAVIFTSLATAFLATFLLYPLILQQKDKTKTRYWLATGTLLLVWVLVIASVTMLMLGETTVHFEVLDFVIYRVTFGPLTSLVIVLMGPGVASFLSLGIMIMMAIRESSKFYRMRAIILSIGWSLVVVGQLFILLEETIIFNPILVPFGIILMTMGIMRRTPTA